MKDFHVIIVGGGLGGLSLAQGLKKNGISCAVYEKDKSRADRLQGYRINLRDHGTDGLRTCLPDDIYKSISNTSGIKLQSIMSITTEQLVTLLAVKFRSKRDHFSVSRIVLHRFLTTGIEDLIHYGHRYERMETLESEKIRVHFANGSLAEGDILVAADGVNSAIRKQLLPEKFEPTKFGTAGIVGKVFIDSSEEMVDIGPLKAGICIVMSTDGRGIFIAPQIYSPEAKETITTLFSGDVDGVTHETQLSPNAAGESLLLIGDGDKRKLVDDARDYIFYGYVTKYPEQDIGIGTNRSISDVSQQDLVDAVLKNMEERNWSRSLVDLVKKTDVNTVGYWPLHTSPKITSLMDYKPSNVTFLGDSIHAMPPTGGEGGNTAIHDAALLLKHLTTVAAAEDRKAVLDVEIQAYEKDMLKFAWAYVRSSYRNATSMTVEGYIFPYILRGIFRIINFIFGVKSAT